MGLDNGIYVRNNDSAKLTPELKAFHDIDDSESEDYSICYWRKCYTIREKIKQALKRDNNSCIINMDEEDVINVKHLLEDFYENKDIGRSIWVWEEVEEMISRQIHNLDILITLMKSNKNLQVYFLDSY